MMIIPRLFPRGSLLPPPPGPDEVGYVFPTPPTDPLSDVFFLLVNIRGSWSFWAVRWRRSLTCNCISSGFALFSSFSAHPLHGIFSFLNFATRSFFSLPFSEPHFSSLLSFGVLYICLEVTAQTSPPLGDDWCSSPPQINFEVWLPGVFAEALLLPNLQVACIFFFPYFPTDNSGFFFPSTHPFVFFPFIHLSCSLFPPKVPPTFPAGVFSFFFRTGLRCPLLPPQVTPNPSRQSQPPPPVFFLSFQPLWVFVLFFSFCDQPFKNFQCACLNLDRIAASLAPVRYLLFVCLSLV